ncbi:hypothetical protein A2160_03385 [Candidatus Beckwithbacteria bacterium RBG_13_42_9]|uniref:Peptidase C39-like domain-containing protein n=1 Tax=Candidatus Beckwithbacteria bacterium RBG_13_42_9 TaxID=1797457 RepID=A0A1F5E8X4_9BACT|nr:MAG: hypothetical protein A2160_03385 [Candidatus Beckwithbacteria bacterium RBG_13_42_9]
MNISPLPIKLVRQQPKTSDCLRCCALMVFNFYADPITKEQVWHKLHVYKKHSGLSGGYVQDLGKLALSKGYQALIYHNDWQWWPKETGEAVKKSKSSLLTNLKVLLKKKKKWQDKKIVRKEIGFLKKGGKFFFELPKTATIDNCLLKKIPVIILVRGEELYQDPESDYSHAMVVVGKKDNNYLIKDPRWALEEIETDHLQYAWARQGGWLLAIYPNKKSEDQLPLFK